MNRASFENLSTETIREVQELDAARRSSNETVSLPERLNEEFLRGIYLQQSSYQLELIEKLIATISEIGTGFCGPEFVVGLYTSTAVNPTMREISRIKERYLLELDEGGLILNLATAVVEVPDIEGPFTIDAIVASFAFDAKKILPELKALKLQLENKIHKRKREKVIFADGYLSHANVKVPFTGPQGKMMAVWFKNREERENSIPFTKGKAVLVRTLLRAARRDKIEFRSDIKHIRNKLKKFPQTTVKIDIQNPEPGKSRYTMVIEYVQ